MVNQDKGMVHCCKNCNMLCSVHYSEAQDFPFHPQSKESCISKA